MVRAKQSVLAVLIVLTAASAATAQFVTGPPAAAAAPSAAPGPQFERFPPLTAPTAPSSSPPVQAASYSAPASSYEPFPPPAAQVAPNSSPSIQAAPYSAPASPYEPFPPPAAQVAPNFSPEPRVATNSLPVPPAAPLDSPATQYLPFSPPSSATPSSPPPIQAAPTPAPDLALPAGATGPHWIATAEALYMQRLASNSRQLLYDPFAAAEVLDASNFNFSMNAGPRLSLRWEDPAGLGLEVSYFGIDGWQSSANVANSAFLFGVGYLSIDDALTVPVTAAQFQYSSRLYSSEINLRYALSDHLTPLVGVRWIDFEDRYSAAGQALSGAFSDLVRGHNQLYGLQLGLDARLFQREAPFQISLLTKAGVYCNAAAQNNDYSDPLYTFSASASDAHLSFVGEIGLTASYQFTKHFALRGGYQALWLSGLALAPNQIAATDFGSAQASVDSSGALFCHGASLGLEAQW